ncbi:MAG: chitobiase/beta-hexosaminidase C-terminal domain-containing protein [Fibrobacterota bacterium]
MKLRAILFVSCAFLINSLQAEIIDVGTVTIDPMFIRPGEELQVTVPIHMEVDGDNSFDVKLGAVFSRDENFGTDGDYLFVYDNSDGNEPVDYDAGQPAFTLESDELYDGWGNYTFTTIAPQTMHHGEDWYLMFVMTEEEWHPPVNTIGDIVTDDSHVDHSQVFEVAVNKAAIINTAYSNDKSDTAVYIISKGLPKAELRSNGQVQDRDASAAYENRRVFATPSHPVEITLHDDGGNEISEAEGARIYYSQNNRQAVIGENEYTGPFEIRESDTIRAVAEVPGYTDPAEGFWVYEQNLPDAALYSNGQVQDYTLADAYDNRREFSTPTHEISIEMRTDDGEVVGPSDSVDIYYARGTEEPVIGENKYTGPFEIDRSDTIRAIAESDAFDSPAEGFWVYEQNLPQALLEADPAAPYDDVYTYDTPSMNVTLTTNEGNTIYYTTDGSEPTTSSESLDEYTGDVEVHGDATLRALATGPAYEPRDSMWLYESILPRLTLKADAGYDDPSDTVEFYFDTTVVLWAEDEAGNTVDDADIYYLIDDGSGAVITEDNGLVYDDIRTIDETVRIQGLAVHDAYQTDRHEWQYRLMQEENSLRAKTFDISYVDGDLIRGDDAHSNGDEVPFGHNLRIVFESPVFDEEGFEASYSVDGGSWETYEYDDTLFLTEAHDDTTHISVRASAHGYDDASVEFYAVRDTVDGVDISPAGEEFISPPLHIYAELRGEWVNPSVWCDAGDGFELYEDRISLYDSRDISFIGKADFAVHDTLSHSYRLVASVLDAWYYDKTGDGRIDSVTLYMDISRDTPPEEIRLYSPFSDEERVLSADDIHRDDTTLSGSFASFSFDGRTSFTEARGRVRGSEYRDGEFTIQDSLAPVVVRAVYSPGEIAEVSPVERFADTLRVQYSDEVVVDDMQRPFVLYDEDDDPYHIYFDHGKSSLKGIDTSIGGDSYRLSRGVFIVDGEQDYRLPRTGDSLNIRVGTTYSLDDELVQQIEGNRKVELLVYDIPYALHISTNTPADPEKKKIPEEIAPHSRPLKTGVVVVADFLMPMEDGAQDGSLTILDNVGNVVQEVSGRDDSNEHLFVELQEEDRTRLVFYWNGHNRSGRSVGRGTYYGILRIDDGRGATVSRTVMIGIGD